MGHELLKNLLPLDPINFVSASSPCLGMLYHTYETEFVLFLAVLENSVLPMG